MDPRRFRAEDRIPGQIGVAGEVDHQRDVAVGDRRDEVAVLQAAQGGRALRPRIEPPLGEGEVENGGVGEFTRAALGEDLARGAEVEII